MATHGQSPNLRSARVSHLVSCRPACRSGRSAPSPGSASSLGRPFGQSRQSILALFGLLQLRRPSCQVLCRTRRRTSLGPIGRLVSPLAFRAGHLVSSHRCTSKTWEPAGRYAAGAFVGRARMTYLMPTVRGGSVAIRWDRQRIGQTIEKLTSLLCWLGGHQLMLVAPRLTSCRRCGKQFPIR